VTQPTTRLTLQRLGETFDSAKPLAKHVVPAQTVCNYFNYWFTFLPGGLSEENQVGFSLRQSLVRFPGAPTAEVGMGGYTGRGPDLRRGPGGGTRRGYPGQAGRPGGRRSAAGRRLRLRIAFPHRRLRGRCRQRTQ
jgi:hypothetical protein